MVKFVYFLDLEGNIAIIGAKSPFFFEFWLFIHISYLVPPFFGILNFIIKIATKI